MLDLGWTELLVIGIVALIVVGPKDLPGMFRALGRFTGKARGMARDFQRAMNEAADDSGMREAAKGLKTATSPKSMGLDALNRAADDFEKWDPAKSAAKKPPQTASEAIKAGQSTAAAGAAAAAKPDAAKSAASKPARTPPAPKKTPAPHEPVRGPSSRQRPDLAEGPRRPPRPISKKGR